MLWSLFFTWNVLPLDVLEKPKFLPQPITTHIPGCFIKSHPQITLVQGLVSYKSSSIMAGLARRNRYDKSVSRAAFSPTLDRSPSAEEFHWEVNHVPGDPLAR